MVDSTMLLNEPAQYGGAGGGSSKPVAVDLVGEVATLKVQIDANPLPVSNATDATGDIFLDAWGIPKVSTTISLFHGVWTFDIPSSMWFMYENGTQVYSSTDITSTNSAARLLTTATNTSLILESRECPRYQPNRGHLFSTALWCPLKTADGTREWGLGIDGENAVFFVLKSDGLLYAVQYSGGVLKRDELIDTSNVPNFDVEKGNVYDIQYQWRGVGNYCFFINLVKVHIFNLLGTQAELTMENPALPIQFHAIRNTEDVEINIGCADITSENGQVDREQYGSAYAENVAVTSNTPVIVVRQPLLINSATNTRTVTLARITVNGSKKGTFKVWVTRDPAAITGAVYVANGGGSFVETDSTAMNAGASKATAVTLTSMKFVTAINVEALSQRSIDNPYRGRIEFPLVRGDYLVVTASSVQTADVVVEWGEQI